MKDKEVRRRIRRLKSDFERHGLVGSILAIKLIDKWFPPGLIAPEYEKAYGLLEEKK